MTSLSDRFRVCAAKHIDNMTQTKSESVSGVDAIYAGKEFLRLHGSIECLTWLQTIVATLTRYLQWRCLTADAFDAWKDMFLRNTPEASHGGIRAPRRNGPFAEAGHERHAPPFRLSPR